MRKTFISIFYFGICTLIAIVMNSCAVSDPRFKSREAPPKSDTEETKEYRFSTKIAKEEAAGDDKKVDIDEVKKRIMDKPNTSTKETAVRDKLMLEVLNLIGTPYSYNGRSNNGIDCSMFSCQIYEKSFGIKLPRSTVEQYNIGESISLSDLDFGDLVFFNTTGKTPSHVGIYLGDDLFAHASRSNGVTISSLQSSYYKKRYVGARRIVE